MTPPGRIPHEVGLLLALHRVRSGWVIAHGPDTFSHHGHPFPRVLIPFLRESFDHGHARLDEQPGSGDTRRVMVTEAGAALLTELEHATPMTTARSQPNRRYRTSHREHG